MIVDERDPAYLAVCGQTKKPHKNVGLFALLVIIAGSYPQTARYASSTDSLQCAVHLAIGMTCDAMLVDTSPPLAGVVQRDRTVLYLTQKGGDKDTLTKTHSYVKGAV